MADDRSVPTPESPTTAPAPEATGAPSDSSAGAAGAADAAPPAGPGVVRRTVDVAADVHDVWRAVTDPDERALWLDDPDALARHVRVDEAAPLERLVWTWWRPGDEGDASTVSVVLTPVDGGGTRVDVTETVAIAPPLRTWGGTARAQASALAAAGPVAGRPARRRLPSWVGCAGDRWDGRLLGLELLFVSARVAVA